MEINEWRIKTQSDTKGIPANFDGQIIIDTAEAIRIEEPITNGVVIVKGSSNVTVVAEATIDAHDKSVITAFDKARVTVYDSANVNAYGHSHICGYGHGNISGHDFSTIVLFNTAHAVCVGNSCVEARDNSQVKLRDSAQANVFDKAYASAYDDSMVVAHNMSVIDAHNYSNILALGNAVVCAYGRSIVELHEFAHATLTDYTVFDAYDSSTVNVDSTDVEGTAHDFVRVDNNGRISHRIQMCGKAQFVTNPQTIKEFLDFHKIEHDDSYTYATLYTITQQLHDDIYLVNPLYPHRLYCFNTNNYEDLHERVVTDNYYLNGLYVGTKQWAAHKAYQLSGASVIEVKVRISEMCVNRDYVGVMNAAKITFVRQVSFDECGVLGKIKLRLIEEEKQNETDN